MSSPSINQTQLHAKTMPINVFGISRQANEDIFDLINQFATASISEDGIMVLPNGKEIDVHSLSGMTVFTAYLQLVEANKELIDNIFVFVKNLENKLDNLLSS